MGCWMPPKAAQSPASGLLLAKTLVWQHEGVARHRYSQWPHTLLQVQACVQRPPIPQGVFITNVGLTFAVITLMQFRFDSCPVEPQKLMSLDCLAKVLWAAGPKAGERGRRKKGPQTLISNAAVRACNCSHKILPKISTCSSYFDEILAFNKEFIIFCLCHEQTMALSLSLSIYMHTRTHTHYEWSICLTHSMPNMFFFHDFSESRHSIPDTSLCIFF